MARPSPQTERVIALLELLAARPGETITLAEATRRLRVNKSTCHAMLTTLTQRAWLLRDPLRKTYRLGPGLMTVARVAARSFPALEIAHPAMVDLSVELGANCAAFGIGDDHTEVLDQIREVRSLGEGLRVGATVPLRPPFSAAAVAWAEPAARERWLGFAPAEVRDRFRKGLDAIRSRGFAVEAVPPPAVRHTDIAHLLSDDLAGVDTRSALSRPEALEKIAHDLVTHDDYLVAVIEPSVEYSVIAISAPVFDADDNVTLVLSAWGFRGRATGVEVDRLGHRLVATTTALSRALLASMPPDAARHSY